MRPGPRKRCMLCVELVPSMKSVARFCVYNFANLAMKTYKCPRTHAVQMRMGCYVVLLLCTFGTFVGR